MPRTRLAYPKEFRQKIIELARSGRSIVELTREFEPSEQTIRNWIRQADINAGHRHDGLSSEEKQELSRLRKENRRLQQERDILAKAAAWFARETRSIPPKSPNAGRQIRLSFESKPCDGCWASPRVGIMHGICAALLPGILKISNCLSIFERSTNAPEAPMGRLVSMRSSKNWAFASLASA